MRELIIVAGFVWLVIVGHPWMALLLAVCL